MHRSWMRPVAGIAQVTAHALRRSPPGLAWLSGAAPAAAGWELVHRITRDFPRPAFAIPSALAHGREVSVAEEVVLEAPFCRLVRFARRTDDPDTAARLASDPKVLLCAPLSGHFATLLRDTVRSMLHDHDVYVTDWVDARVVPLSAGTFGLDDYVAYVERFIRHLGQRELHVVAVCQPTVPALAAVARIASAGEPTPRTLVLMGGPIDCRRSPTQVNRFATERPISWFEQNLVHRVPAGYPGAGRRVYPGFLQLTAFVSMNPRRHLRAYQDYWLARLTGDDAKAAEHERFYDEYNAVLDMDAAYYLETVRTVFQELSLARGTWEIDGELVRLEDVRDTAVLTIEGAEDDVTGAGQTHAALELLRGVPDASKRAITAPGCGHYGIFSGRRWRESIYPELRSFLGDHALRADRPAPDAMA
ncbi:MAG: polyhydroxyalkanoate depolymerase [Myxococcota bacterium]|nr:polyhydroxyalkanoate depolymerase [Myxococcota bacterium]